MRIHALALTAGFCIVSPAFAQVDPEAKRVMDQMIEAISKAKTISYQVEAKGVGGVFETLPTTKAEVIAARAEDNPGTWRMRVMGRATATGMEPTEVMFATDGTKRVWIDYPNKQVVERAATDQAAVGQAITTATVRELFETQPFSKERNATNMKLEAPVELDGVTCEVVLIDPGPEQTKTRYCVAKTDHMPRRTELIIQGAGIDGKRVCNLTKVKVDEPPPPGAFAISTPDGYTLNTVFNATTAPAAGTTPARANRAIGPNLGEIAPDFNLVSSTGEKAQLFSLRGQVVVVDFFGTWNLSSKRSTAELQKIAAAYKDKPVKVFGLAVRERDDAAPTKFFKDNNLTYTLLLKGDESAKAYRVKKYPTLFVVGKEGEVVFTISNYDDKSAKEITDAIDKALADTGKTEPGKADPTGDAGRTKGQPGSATDADR